MAAARAKLVFVLVFVLNCLLWSHSRYANVGSAGLLRSPAAGGLLKRSADIGGASVDDQCMPSKLKFPDQCQHAQNQCAASDTVLAIPYTQKYFCTTEPERPFAFAGLLLWLIFLFSTLGISSSEFFCPNLGTLSDTLGLDENVAGVTFLAFGNGSPDIFSTFTAMRLNSASLAIGELLGAASFIVSVVVGSMCIIKPFTVEPYPFLRDVSFFTIAVALLVAVMWDGELHFWETLSLAGLYLLYVMVVVLGTWWTKRYERKRLMDELVRQEYAEESVPQIFYRDDEPYRDDTSSVTATPAHELAPPPNRVRAISSPTPRHTLTRLELPPRPHSRLPSPSRSPIHTPRRSPRHSPTTSLSRHSGHMASFSLVGALEFREIITGLQPHSAGASLGAFETPISPFAGGYYNRPPSRSRTPVSRAGSERDPWDDALNDLPLSERPSPTTEPGPGSLETPVSPPILDSYGGDSDGEGMPPIPVIQQTPPTPRVQQYEVPIPSASGGSEKPRGGGVKHALTRAFEILFPALNGFFGKSLLVQLASLFAAPAVLALTLTLPVVVTQYGDAGSDGDNTLQTLPPHPMDEPLIEYDEEAEGIERTLIAEEEVQEVFHDHLRFDKWLMSVQSVLGPLFCAKVVFDGTKYEFWMLLAAGISGIAMAILVAVFADDGRNPAGRFARCLMGFCVAVVWIMAIADEVVSVLQTFGIIFGLSDAIIGLTIFAMGNSLADLVANISVAVFAPIMGFSACFGGPMLNMLLGVGLSGSYIISQTQEPYKIKFSRTLIISSMQLLVLLVVSGVVIPLNKYHLSRQWGIVLIISYVIVMAVNVWVEVHFPN